MTNLFQKSNNDITLVAHPEHDTNYILVEL